MINISSHKVRQIIELAREFDVQTAPGDPSRSAVSDDDIWQSVFEARRSSPAYGELRAFINGLNEDEETDLVALFWIGRGSFGKEELEEARTTARNRTYPRHV